MKDPIELEKQLTALAQASGYWSERTRQAIQMAVFHEDQEQVQFLVDNFQRAIIAPGEAYQLRIREGWIAAAWRG